MPTYSLRDGWDHFVALAGYNHPAVKPNLHRCGLGEAVQGGYHPQPWVEMPPGGEPFDVIRDIATPDSNDTETVVLSYQIPFGFDGVILGIGNLFSGGTFEEGSGDLVWRIRVGQPGTSGRPVRNYSNIRTSMGGFSAPRDVFGGILVHSEDYITYTVTHASGSPIVPGGTVVICNVAGFYWPRGSAEIR